MADLETLTLRITEESSKAFTAIKNLAKRLDDLSVSIAKLEVGKLNDLANGLVNLNTAIMQVKDNSRASDYSRMARELNSLSSIDANGLTNLAQSLDVLMASLRNVTDVASFSQEVKDLVTTIGSLGAAKVQKAITNIPQLEKALSHLIKNFSHLPNINQSIIDFVKSLTDLASQGQHVGSASKSVANSLDTFSTSANRATRRSHSLASTIGTLYAKFWLLMRGVRGLKNAFMDAADYLEAYNYFEVTAKKIGKDTFTKAGVGSAEEYADAFTKTLEEKLHKMSGLELDLENRLIKTTNAKSLGLNLTELTQYQASIASITNAMGVSQEVAQSTAKAFSMLAGDMGSLKNLDFEQVSQNLQSALTGQARALYKYGIDLTAATLQQYAYAEGIEKSVSEMTQGEKAQLRLLAILDQSKVSWGDLANTINSPANQLRMLKTNLKETGTVMGQLFIPVMQSVLPVLNGVSLAIKQLMVDIAQLLGINLDLESFGQFGDEVTADVEEVEDLNKALKETKKGIREFDELKVINSGKNAGAGLGSEIDLTKQIVEATNEYEKVWEEAYARMTSKAQEIAGYISGAFEPIKTIIEDFHVGDFFKAGEDVSALITSITGFFTDAINGVDWAGIGEDIGDFFSGMDWIAIFSGIGSLIGSAIQAAINLWNGAFDAAPFETALITAFAILKFTSLGQTLTDNMALAVGKWFKKQGVTKDFMAKAGIGAIAIGLSVAFTIDNVTDVQASKYAALSLKSLSKIGISSLLAGAGFTLMASALGLAEGLTGLGLVFVVSAGLSIAFNIIAAKLFEPEPNVEREIAEQQYAWVEEKHLDNIDVITNITMKAGQVDDQMGEIDFLSKKVLELSDSYDDLTQAEKEQLKYYSDELIKIMPEIAGQIDSVTGAYRGTREEIEKLIETQKEQIRSAATMDILKDLEIQKQKIQPDYDKLSESFSKASKEYSEAINYLKGRGFSYESIYKMQRNDYDFSKISNPLDRNYAKSLKQLFENKQAASDALGKIEGDWNQLTEKIEYYTGVYEESVKTAFENTAESAKNGIDKTEGIIKEQKLPKAMSDTLSRIDSVILKDGKVSEYDMNALFSTINSSFAGLGEGDVPQEMQDTMNAIKAAIINGSPELINYMAKLKIQMEEAFVNAKYTSGGEVLWNVNGISERLDKDVKSITGALDHMAKPTLTAFEKDLHELFGDKLPEDVDKSFQNLANTIESGKGKDAVLKALKTVEDNVVIAAYGLGMNLEFGAAEGIYAYIPQLAQATEDSVDQGYADPWMKKTESNSPSRLARRLAEYLPEGAALGVEDGTPKLEQAVDSMVDTIKDSFGDYKYNIPQIDIGSSRNANAFNYGAMDSNNAFMSQVASAFSQAAANGQTEVVFRIEGDPHGMFTVMREEDTSFRKRTGRSAFAN